MVFTHVGFLVNEPSGLPNYALPSHSTISIPLEHMDLGRVGKGIRPLPELPREPLQGRQAPLRAHPTRRGGTRSEG
jgi:hypothetical protein